MNHNYDIIPIPISIRGSDGRYIYVNTAWCEMFSVDVQHALGFNDTELNLGPLAFAQSEPGSTIGEYSFRDVFITTKDKGRLLLELIETRIDEAKGLPKVMCVHQDMTGIGWRMDDMNRNLQRSERRAKQKAQQYAKLVLDTREPISQMLTFCEKLKTSKLDGKQTGMLAIINDNARIIQRVLNMDTGISILETESMDTSDERIQIEEMIGEVISMYDKVALDKNVTIAMSVSEELRKPIITDRVHLRQIVVNMVESGIRGSNPGRVSIQAQLLQGSETPLFLKVAIENPKSKEKKGTKTNLPDIGLGLSHKILRGLCGIVGGRFEITHESDGSNGLRVYLRATLGDSDDYIKS